MKVLVVSFLAVLSSASAGSAVAWPGARDVYAHPTVLATPTVVKTVVPPQTKVFGFSTTQYINSVPSAVPIGLQPQVHYQVPQLNHFAPAQHTAFYPVAGASYFPSNVYYPPFAIAPAAPGYPVSQIIPGSEQPPQNIPGFPQGIPSYPQQGANPSQEQPNTPQEGDADTAVVDSADFPQQQAQDKPQDQPQDQPQEQSPSTEAPQEDQPAAPQSPPAGNFPSLPQAPSFPSLPQFPQGSIPQFPQGGIAPGLPSFPQFPQGPLPQFPQGSLPQFPQGSLPQFPQGSLPQFPQGSLPQFPQIPQFPSNPSFPQSPTPTPPSSFPAGSGGDSGLNDEDTISVESA